VGEWLLLGLSAGIHWLPQMVLCIELTPAPTEGSDPLGYPGAVGEWLLLGLSAGIHWLPQMVLCVELTPA
jgi:hypothetical protein